MTKPPEDWTDFDEKGWRRLHELQPTLLPDHAKEIIAIDVETGDYYLGAKSRVTVDALRAEHPNRVAWVARVDGGPVVKYYDRIKP